MSRSPLPVLTTDSSCWKTIGIRGDRSCPELSTYIHCNNCPVFAAAGRRFLDAPSPPGYVDEWTARLAIPEEEIDGDIISVLVFRVGPEWLALPVATLTEVTRPRRVHRIPHRGGILAGLVNIRGELLLCVHLHLLLGIEGDPHPNHEQQRLVVIQRDPDTWVFQADAVDQVHRVTLQNLLPPAPTLDRAHAKLTRGVFSDQSRSVGLLDETRLFPTLRERLR
ncbi:MAG: chemotaxis protein CheW [Gemmataceae bacterium]|nr:chemotaxis protein CheW [Gemmata sp.]MDW8196068.1 chemotaxis protein CheW [Gemmataceae bacterium]